MRVLGGTDGRPVSIRAPGLRSRRNWPRLTSACPAAASA